MSLLLSLAAWGCASRPATKAPEPAFMVDRDLVRALRASADETTPDRCALADDIRPALGCPTDMQLAFEQGVQIGPADVDRRYAVPAELAGGGFVVRPAIRIAGTEALPSARWQPLAVNVVQQPQDFVDVRVRAISDKMPSMTAQLRVRATRLPAPRRVRKTRAIPLGAQARLDGAVGVDPLEWGRNAPAVEFRVLARSGGKTTELFHRVVDPRRGEAGEWHDYRVDLDGQPRTPTRFAFVARVLGRGAEPSRSAFSFPLWGAPRIASVRSRAGRWNLLLVSVDTLRADYVGAYGSRLPTTPALDRLAADGTLFERVTAPYPATLTSHASMLTGLYPSAHGVFGVFDSLAPEIPTLAEVLAESGYETGAVTEDGMLLASAGFPRGFRAYRETTDLSSIGGRVHETFDAGLRWLAAHRNEPFFLFLHTYQVHTPYALPPTYDVFTSYRRDGRDVPIDASTPPEVRCSHVYAGEVRYFDGELARLLAGLAELGEGDRTLVVVTADHGEEFGEHGGASHGVTLYDEVLRVPLVMRAPTLIPAGLRVGTEVSLVDLVPTVLALLGLRPSGEVQGTSLLPLLRDPRAPGFAERVIYSDLLLGPYVGFDFATTGRAARECNFVPRSGPPNAGTRYFVAARTGRYKWIVDETDHRVAEFYDVESDAGERHSTPGHVLTPYGAAVADLYVQQGKDKRVRLARSRERTPGPDDRTIEKLRALGYVN